MADTKGIDLKRALGVAKDAAIEAGALLRAEFHRAGGPRHEGAHHADVDGEAEAILRARLLEAFPGTAFVGEETGSARTGSGLPTWYVDPNDGTKSFLEGMRGSAVSIALVDGARPVLGVVYAPLAPDDDGDLIAWAEGEPLTRNGQRVERAPLGSTLGASDVVLISQAADRNSAANAEACAPARFRAVPSIAYRLALVAVGDGEAGVSLNGPVHWDYAAGHALLRAVGGELVGRSGEVVRYDARGGGDVFGGQVEVARTLAKRAWGAVFRAEAPQPEIARAYPLVTAASPHVVHAARLRHAQGCLLGQLIGDSLGALVEFRSAASIARDYPDGVRELADGGPHSILAGQPTDDSELALLLARSIVGHGRFRPEAVRVAYRAWVDSNPFDMGHTTRVGLAGRPNVDSQANGALMRVSPLGIFGVDLGTSELGELARTDAAITHPHRVCQDASAAFAVAIAEGIRSGGNPQLMVATARSFLVEHDGAPTLLDALDAAQIRPPAEFQHQQGWVLTAFQNAFFELQHAPSFEEGLVRTVGRGGDTDTNGAIAGALLGARWGRDAIPQRWQRILLSCRPIRARNPRPKCFWPVDALELAEALLVAGRN